MHRQNQQEGASSSKLPVLEMLFDSEGLRAPVPSEATRQLREGETAKGFLPHPSPMKRYTAAQDGEIPFVSMVGALLVPNKLRIKQKQKNTQPNKALEIKVPLEPQSTNAGQDLCDKPKHGDYLLK